MIRTLASLIVFASLSSIVASQDKPEVVFFGNAKCVCGKDSDKHLLADCEGQKIFACSKECQKKIKEGIKADAKGTLEKAYPADKLVDLKNDTCPCMGKPSKEDKTVVFQGHKVRVCCPKCVDKFKTEPNRYLAVAKDKNLKFAGNKNCPVMPKEAVTGDIWIRCQGYLIGLCCDDCPEEFEKEPAKFMKALDLDKGAKGEAGKKG